MLKIFEQWRLEKKIFSVVWMVSLIQDGHKKGPI